MYIIFSLIEIHDKWKFEDRRVVVQDKMVIHFLDTKVVVTRTDYVHENIAHPRQLETKQSLCAGAEARFIRSLTHAF